MRTVPHNSEVEQSVLGAMLLHPSVIPEVVDALSSSDFYGPAHQLIFDEIKSIYDSGKTPDVLTVGESLKRSGKIDRVGGAANLLTIQNAASYKSQISSHTELLKGLSVRRRLIMASSEIGELAYESPLEVDDLLSVSEKAILDISSSGEIKKGLVHAGFSTTAHDLAHLWSSGGEIKGLPTGLVELDRLISGLEPQKFYVIAARPGMGKSALGINIASHVAINSNRPVAFFSLEMGEPEINARLTSSLSGVPSWRLEKGRLRTSDWERIADTAAKLDAAPLLIDDDSMVSVDDIASRSRRIKAEMGDLALIVVDYIQLMSGKGENRQVEVSYISRKLKILSKDLDIPVIGLSQLSRQLESRADKRPMLSDLRESGSIEQDSNTVIFVYREELYDPDTSWYGMPELIVAKQRSGSTGSVRVAFVDDQTRFVNLSREG